MVAFGLPHENPELVVVMEIIPLLVANSSLINIYYLLMNKHTGVYSFVNLQQLC